MSLALRFKIVCSLSSACLLRHLSASGLSRLGGPVFSFYPINMAARACHRDEIENQGQSGLEGLDDRWTVLYWFFFCLHKAIVLVGSVIFLFYCDTRTEPVEKRGCVKKKLFQGCGCRWKFLRMCFCMGVFVCERKTRSENRQFCCHTKLDGHTTNFYEISQICFLILQNHSDV